ncbi:ABC transporter permease [Aquimarina sp. BL5]|uniref:ABC transporter permease n=1 Tax=Aquimarina sp. BL5 TaxID=1714860 RepID=UPI000E4D392A|nr:ABC transporter permease [Aquimarina sp. BL5]AXT50383.1 ABC transporter permease [Aquimarina sp. BL5]RKN06373.1 FtsX-like permease family protein [Aquimarina sp. BL5]
MIRNYFKIAWRNLWRRRGFTFINITGLSIGMTASFLMLLYVSFELSYDSFHSKTDDIYRVVADIKTPSDNIEANITAWAVPPNLEKDFPEIISAVRINDLNMIVRKDDLKFKETNAIAADSSFFSVFDFELLQGNPKEVLKKQFSIVLSETIAKKYFGDQNPIGKSLKITEEGYNSTVTGVMKDFPENSHIKADIILSLTTFTQHLDKELDTRWGSYDAAAYILVNSNTDPYKLAAKFPAFLEKHSGAFMKQSKMFVTLNLEPLKSLYLESTRGGTGGGSMTNVYIFSIIAIFILLIASINFINLTTARSVERAKEVGIRKVMGAEKQQLSLQFIGESIITCLLAFLITTLLTIITLPFFNEIAGKVISEGLFSNYGNILKLLGISLAIGLFAGIYPSIVLSSFKPIQVLKGNFSTGGKGVLLRKSLVIVQFTISIILITGTIIIYNQMKYMQNQELGFNKDRLLILEAESSKSQVALKHAIDKIPGVKFTSLGSSVPGGGNSSAYSEIENKAGDLQIANLDLYFIDHEYIPQFDLKIIAGRAFSKDFASDSTQAMIINEEAVKLLGYNNPQNAIGARFKQWGREGQVIGVIKNFHFNSLHDNIGPLTMRMEQTRNDLITVKLAPNNIKKTIGEIEKLWGSFLPEQPFDYFFLDDSFNEQYESEERFGNLFLYFASLAILISCLGLLGLAAYSTLQRRREIGIRKVIGASVSEIVNLLSKDFLKLVMIAFAIASPIAWYVMYNWLQDFAFRIDIKWWMFLLSGGSAILIAILTVSFHAVKASLSNPVKALRTE